MSEILARQFNFEVDIFERAMCKMRNNGVICIIWIVNCVRKKRNVNKLVNIDRLVNYM